MTREEADYENEIADLHNRLDIVGYDKERLREEVTNLDTKIKALGEDMRICQKSITDEKVLIGFNMAVALCNKHLAESEG